MPALLSPETLINTVVVLFGFTYWSVVFITLYHLTRFGIGVQPKRFAAIFLFGSVILFSLSAMLYINVDVGELIQLARR